MRRQQLTYLDNKPPEPEAGRQDRLAIVASIGPDDADLTCWLKFHFLAGVRDFHLYDDGAPDSTLVQALALADKEGINLTAMPWNLVVNTDYIKKNARTEFSSLLLAYCHAIGCYGSRSRWFAFISTSDFIVPKKHSTLPEALESLNSFSNVSLPRQHFAAFKNSAQISATYRSQPVRKSKQAYRCLVDPCKILRLQQDRFNTSDMGKSTANDQGQVSWHSGPLSYRRGWSKFPSTENIQLNHYHLTAAATQTSDLCALEFLARHGFSSADEFIAACTPCQQAL